MSLAPFCCLLSCSAVPGLLPMQMGGHVAVDALSGWRAACICF